MANEKVIAANGVSDEDVAHIRLLIRKAAGALSHAWRWGSDSQSDILVVDTSNFAGQMARSRAKVTGMRVVLVCDAGVDTEGDPAFIRPFKPENIIDVLNRATGASGSMSGVVRAGSDFFLSQSQFDLDSENEDLRLIRDEPRMSDPDVAPGLDELLRNNPQVDIRRGLNPQKLDESAEIAGAGAPTRRSAHRADVDREALAVPLNAASAARTPERKQMIEDLSLHRLRDLLEGGLLGGPVQIAWKGAGTLSLDPKHKVFHSGDSLRDLEVYCRESSRLSDWQRLTTAELGIIRESQPGQLYQNLIWLDVLLHSGGRLASNLDPGGTFSLTSAFKLEQDYPSYARISTALMQPARLHEIAASCRCEMTDVFNVVNAYDAIGWLKWTPRPPRHLEEDDKSKSSFLKRLRNPFGKA